MFWDQETETLSRPTLEQLQLKRLQDTVGRVAQRVPFYRDKFAESGVAPGDIKSLADARRLPFTTGADLRTVYPEGLLAVERDEAVRLHTSSGTTGKPKAIFFSRNDVNNAAELSDHALILNNSSRANPTRDGRNVILVCQVRCIFQTALLEHIPNFSGHLCFNGRSDEERMRFEFLFRKRFVNAIQRGAGGFPMLICTGRINAAFEFAERDVFGRRVDNFTIHFGERTIKQ